MEYPARIAIMMMRMVAIPAVMAARWVMVRQGFMDTWYDPPSALFREESERVQRVVLTAGRVLA